MQRDLWPQLIQWKNHPLRKPLVLRGARQVGKSWLAKELGRTEFANIIVLNFDKQPSAIELFSGDLDAKYLASKIAMFTQQSIIPGETLLFFDEIQECPQALKSLRYFKEDFPELHIIAAGSLLDFLIEKIGLPVGRVQFLYCYPLSFGEFLTALGHQQRREATFSQMDPIFHQQNLELLKDYFWLGGMPAVVDAWVKYRDPIICQDLQDEVILSYRQDFPKYAHSLQLENVEKVFSNIPRQLGNKFKYVNVDGDARAQSLKIAMELLIKAGIAHRVKHCSAQGFPLAASADEQKFKLFFFDIGLAQRLLGLNLSQWISQKIDVQHLGAICEQFVAQEYIAYTSSKSAPELYYWHREAKNSNAEIDFIFSKMQDIIPVEVKAGRSGTLKSLHLFLQDHPHCQYGIKISQHPYTPLENKIMNLPLYGIEEFVSGKF